MALEKNYYKSILPKEVHLFFSPTMVKSITDDVQQQILNGEQEHKNKGQGLFIFDDLVTTTGTVRIAVSVQWITDTVTEVFEVFNILEYHLFSGEGIPEELLIAIEDLGTEGKWNYPNKK